MAHELGYRTRVPRKRYTWPRTQVDQLETIPESPQMSQVAKFMPVTLSEEHTHQAEDVATLLDSKQCARHDEHVVPSGAAGQMIWYSRQLELSYRDRERLGGRVSELKVVCKSQSKTNASLIRELQSWQKNYQAVESELVDATRELEEVKAHVRSVETANANLRYALIQAREEQERARRRRWNNLARRCWRRCTCWSEKLIDSCRSPNTKKLKKHEPDQARSTTRPESRCPILHSSTSKTSLSHSGTC